MNYLGSNQRCETLRKCTSSKHEWIWINTYQNLYERASIIVKRNVVMTFYNVKEKIYLETGAIGVTLGASHLQVREGM